jgi:hypothetical protein
MNPNPQQPLEVAPEQRVTLAQLKHRAESIQNLALSETKRVTNQVVEQDITRIAVIAVGTVLVVASLAYFLGRRAARAAVGDVTSY